MAQLPARVWELFTTVNKKYEEGSLKNQKPSRKEVLTKMSMKAVHFRNLSALSDAERETLLKKVDHNCFKPIARQTFRLFSCLVKLFTEFL